MYAEIYNVGGNFHLVVGEKKHIRDDKPIYSRQIPFNISAEDFITEMRCKFFGEALTSTVATFDRDIHMDLEETINLHGNQYSVIYSLQQGKNRHYELWEGENMTPKNHYAFFKRKHGKNAQITMVANQIFIQNITSQEFLDNIIQRYGGTLISVHHCCGGIILPNDKRTIRKIIRNESYTRKRLFI